MTLKPAQRAPLLITLAVIVLVCLLRILDPEPIENLERITYDIRVRRAAALHPDIATNLGFIFIDENTVRAVNDGSLGFRFGLYWPRQVYARLVDELKQQGAKAAGFDIILKELRPDHPSVQLANGGFTESDQFFADAIHRAGNVVLAVTKDSVPPPLFATNAAALGHIATEMDPDGRLRRAEAFRAVRQWHLAFRQVEADPEFGVDLNNVEIAKDAITLKRSNGDDIRVPLDKDGNFDLSDFGGSKLPPGIATKQKPFSEERVWHMGIVLAAMELGLDLDKANIDLPGGRITLPGSGGSRVIPVDREGLFYIDWCIPPTDKRLTKEALESLLAQNLARLHNKSGAVTNRWAGKLAVIGSSAQLGNNLTDRGATPLAKATLLVAEHWNVANSVLLGRFVTRSSLLTDALLIALLTVITAIYLWRFGVLASTIAFVATCLAYVGIAFTIYNSQRYWLPIVYPIAGAALLTYVSLVAWKLIFEQAERRRIISVFGTVVSSKIMDELLARGLLSVGGVRREISVMFADVRGFTELTDRSQEQALEYVRSRKLTSADAELYFDKRAGETLETVNTYLGVVADTVITHDATLDKFIGDCVMCFWGAPLPMSNHATACVRAAIAAQRAIADLNREREAENQKRETENAARVAAGEDPLPMLPVLMLGTGINTGVAIAGLMGSAAKTKNYTVFGREVNLASRLESLSGRGHIYISEATLDHLRRESPDLAKTCVELPPQRVKGISSEVKVFEVPWELPQPA